jgi:hypothetical protein
MMGKPFRSLDWILEKLDLIELGFEWATVNCLMIESEDGALCLGPSDVGSVLCVQDMFQLRGFVITKLNIYVLSQQMNKSRAQDRVQ